MSARRSQRAFMFAQHTPAEAGDGRERLLRRLAMRHGLTPSFVGVVIGVGGALAATRLATTLLHGVAPRDPLTFVGVVALLVLVALGATMIVAGPAGSRSAFRLANISAVSIISSTEWTRITPISCSTASNTRSSPRLPPR